MIIWKAGIKFTAGVKQLSKQFSNIKEEKYNIHTCPMSRPVLKTF